MLAAPRDLLPHDEILALVARLRSTGDARARDRLVRAHILLVFKLAREYRWSGQELDDLVQAGVLGLLRAIEKYDPQRGAHLSTYATPWIRALILRFILDNWRLVRFGTTQRRRAAFFGAWREGDELATHDPMLLRHVTRAEVRLDAPLAAGDPEPRVTSLRAADDARPDVIVERRELRARFEAAVATFVEGLAGRDRQVFRERWQADEPRTLAELGVELGVTRERVRQLERRILDRLQAHLVACLGDPEGYAPALAA